MSFKNVRLRTALNILVRTTPSHRTKTFEQKYVQKRLYPKPLEFF